MKNKKERKKNVTKTFISMDSVEDENDFIFDHCLDNN